MQNEYIGVFKKDERGSTIWNDLKALKTLIKELPAGKYHFKISKFKENRSIEQNYYYWKLLSIIANQIGYEKEEMHEIFKYKFLRRTRENEITGELYDYIKSTKKLKIPEFTEYINKIKRYVDIELQIKLPNTFE